MYFLNSSKEFTERLVVRCIFSHAEETGSDGGANANKHMERPGFLQVHACGNH